MFKSITDASFHYGVCTKTIRKWADEGIIPCTRTKGGHRRIDVTHPYPSKNEQSGFKDRPAQRFIACYVRVSSKEQEKHQEAQESFVFEKAKQLQTKEEEEIKVFKDIASGLNFKRKGLQALLEQVMQKRVKTLVVAYRDRLARFGFEHFQWLLDRFGTKIVVLNAQEADPAERVTEDLLAVVTVFAARAHGMRSYKRKLEEEFGQPQKRLRTNVQG